MGFFDGRLKLFWAWMLEPPWQDSELKSDALRWVIWGLGWAWTIAGIVLGAMFAPSLVQSTGLAGAPYSDWLIIAIAVFAGFLVQFVGWCLMALVVVGAASNSEASWSFIFLPFIVIPLPFIGVGYGIYRYLTWVGAGQREVTTAFVGALLVKTFAIPLVKGIVTGTLFRWFMRWLRGGKDTEKAD